MHGFKYVVLVRLCLYYIIFCRLKCCASTNNVGDPCTAGSPSDVGKVNSVGSHVLSGPLNIIPIRSKFGNATRIINRKKT